MPRKPETTDSNFVLGNAKIAKVFPIVYCSDGFCELSGYSRAQIMQKSCACNFLYGQKTDVQHRAQIAAALEQRQELKLEVILYKSSGRCPSARWLIGLRRPIRLNRSVERATNSRPRPRSQRHALLVSARHCADSGRET